MVLWRAAIVCFLLACVVPATAAPADIELDAAMPAVAQGRVDLAAEAATLLLQDTTGDVDLALTGAFQVDRFVYRAFGYVHPGDPEMRLLWGHDMEHHQVNPAQLRLLERHEGFQFLAWDADARAQAPAAAVAATTSDADVAAHDERPGFTLRTGRAMSPPFEHTIERGLLAGQTAFGDATASGAFGAFFQGAVLEADGQPIQAHFREEQRPGTVYDPLSGRWIGGGSHTEYVQEYVTVAATDARLLIQHAGVPLRTYAEAIALDIEGQAVLSDAHGHVDVTDDEGTSRHGLAGEELTLEGLFRLDLTTDGDRLGATGSGDVTHVAYGVVGASYDWGTVATVTFGAALVAALAWLAKGFGVAGYARVQGPKVLEHPGRQEVYERVKLSPGIGFADLVRALPFGESTLQYHLRVLEKNEFVTRIKDGRYQRFFDRQAGLYSGGRKVAVSALRNGTTARIARTILAEPGIAQQDLAARFGIAASTVNWHIQRLHRVGLVDPRRDHPHTRYYAGTAWSTIPGDEHARLVHA